MAGSVDSLIVELSHGVLGFVSSRALHKLARPPITINPHATSQKVSVKKLAVCLYLIMLGLLVLPSPPPTHTHSHKKCRFYRTVLCMRELPVPRCSIRRRLKSGDRGTEETKRKHPHHRSQPLFGWCPAFFIHERGSQARRERHVAPFGSMD